MSKPGLYANINRRKRLGISRSKKDSTITDKAYANMQAGFPKKKKKTLVGQEKTMPRHTDKKMKNNNNKNKNLAAMYGDPNKVTRGDVIAAAIKNKKKKNTLVG